MLIRKAMLIRDHADPGARAPAVLCGASPRSRMRERGAMLARAMGTDDRGFAVTKGRRLTLDRIRECADG